MEHLCKVDGSLQNSTMRLDKLRYPSVKPSYSRFLYRIFFWKLCETDHAQETDLELPHDDVGFGLGCDPAVAFASGRITSLTNLG